MIKLIINNDNRNVMRYLLLSVLVVSLVGIMIPDAFAENVPEWVKNTAGWWATDAISETEFVNAVEFLIKENIIQVDASQTPETSQSVPEWVKNTAGWWADEKVSDNEFLNSLEFLINNGIIQIKAEQSELQILLQKRENLIDFIWKGDEFPTRLPDSIEQNISDENFDDLKNLKKIDRITVEMKHGVNSIAYLFYPKELLHSDLIIYHTGHSDYLHDGKKQIRFFLDRGYTVLAFSMPLHGMNSAPVIMLDGNEIKLEKHNQFELLESDKFSPISYFVEPVAVSLNFIDKNFDYTNYHMIGISGGGWTTVLYPAIDQRILHATSVAASIPLELRILDRDKGDYEQWLPELYRIANYYDLYVLASFGTDRKLTQYFNSNDSCCFAARNLDLSYENEIKDRLASLGSGEFAINVLDSDYHFLTGGHLINFYLDIDEKNEQYFHDLELRKQTKDLSSIFSKNYVIISKDYSYTDFTGSFFVTADFSNSNLINTNFFSCEFDSINLTNADITNSDFSYSWLNNFKVEKTTIHNVDFTKSGILFADFTKSDLKNVRFDMSTCFNCIFDNMDISEIKIAKNNIHPTNFAGSSFKNVDFRNWEHGTVDFAGKLREGDSGIVEMVQAADLTGSNFSGVDLKNVIFTRGSAMEGYEIEIVNLSNAIFSFADLSYHDLRRANLEGANLEGANLEGANLEGANLEGANLKCVNHPICNS